MQVEQNRVSSGDVKTGEAGRLIACAYLTAGGVSNAGGSVISPFCRWSC